MSSTTATKQGIGTGMVFFWTVVAALVFGLGFWDAVIVFILIDLIFD